MKLLTLSLFSTLLVAQMTRITPEPLSILEEVTNCKTDTELGKTVCGPIPNGSATHLYDVEAVFHRKQDAPVTYVRMYRATFSRTLGYRINPTCKRNVCKAKFINVLVENGEGPFFLQFDIPDVTKVMFETKIGGDIYGEKKRAKRRNGYPE